MMQGTIEEKIYQRQTAKQGLSGTVADAKESVKIEFSHEELKVITAYWGVFLFNANGLTACQVLRRYLRSLLHNFHLNGHPSHLTNVVEEERCVTVIMAETTFWVVTQYEKKRCVTNHVTQNNTRLNDKNYILQ